MAFLLFVGGLAVLILGAEALVRGAAQLAMAMGVSRLLVGLTVVAFGTSSPELAVSVKSALSGQADIALGNVVGSNIFNVLFILGLSALIAPLSVSRNLVRLDVPLMVAASVAVLVVAADMNISRIEGMALFAGLLAYTGFLIYRGRNEGGDPRGDHAAASATGSGAARRRWLVSGGLALGGLGMLVLGSRWLVDGAVSIAQYLGVSELFVGLTIIAAGTSLPELATSTVASMRGERDIAVGNIVGSNLFNILGVLGLAGVVAPVGIAVSAPALQSDIPIMIAVAAACLPVFFVGGVIWRWEGALFLAYYAAYTAYLVLAATGHDALPVFGTAVLYFVLPLTSLAWVALSVRAVRSTNRRQRAWRS